MYNQTLDDLPRTNNAVEGWHRSFQANVGAYHPNFWKFIDILKGEQNLTQVNIAQARAGHQPEPQRRRYLDSNQRIKNIVQDYHNRDIMQYLQGLAHNTSHVSALYQPKRFFLKTINLPELILVTIALSISYALEKRLFHLREWNSWKSRNSWNSCDRFRWTLDIYSGIR